MTTTVQQALNDVSSGLKAGETAAVSGVSSLIGGALISFTADQLKILGDAIDALSAARASGASWEDSFTAAYNELSAEESEEVKTDLNSLLSAFTAIAKLAESAFTSAA